MPQREPDATSAIVRTRGASRRSAERRRAFRPLESRRLDLPRRHATQTRNSARRSVPIPGTRIRFGLDGIIGLVPGIGDVLVGLASIVFPLAGWIRGLPYVTLVRMVANIGIGVIVGSIPLLGDAFDIAWKANRRNYRLLTRHLGEPRRHTGRDWAFLLLLVAILGTVFAVPVVLILWLVTWLLHQ